MKKTPPDLLKEVSAHNKWLRTTMMRVLQRAEEGIPLEGMKKGRMDGQITKNERPNNLEDQGDHR